MDLIHSVPNSLVSQLLTSHVVFITEMDQFVILFFASTTQLPDVRLGSKRLPSAINDSPSKFQQRKSQQMLSIITIFISTAADSVSYNFLGIGLRIVFALRRGNLAIPGSCLWLEGSSVKIATKDDFHAK